MSTLYRRPAACSSDLIARSGPVSRRRIPAMFRDRPGVLAAGDLGTRLGMARLSTTPRRRRSRVLSYLGDGMREDA
jgi:hypothetical protein